MCSDGKLVDGCEEENFFLPQTPGSPRIAEAIAARAELAGASISSHSACQLGVGDGHRDAARRQRWRTTDRSRADAHGTVERVGDDGNEARMQEQGRRGRTYRKPENLVVRHGEGSVRTMNLDRKEKKRKSGD